MIDKISYKLIEYYSGNKEDDTIGYFIESMEKDNQIDNCLNKGGLWIRK